MKPQLKVLGTWALAGSLLSCASSKEVTMKTGSPGEVQSTAEMAYIYAYPLVLMGVSRDVMTAVPRKGQRRAPLNQIANMRTVPDEKFTDVVTPNADTLYSSAWLDISKEPMVISVPDAGDRYYMLPMLSAWTDVIASPGSRTTGNHKGHFAVTGPNWNGELPTGVTQIKAPTNSVWMIGRTKTSGPADYSQVHAFQDRLKITSLSEYGKNLPEPISVPFSLDVDSRTPPVEQVENMDAQTFFAYFAKELKQNPPASGDSKMISQLATMGVLPGQDFYFEKLNPEQKRALNTGYAAGQARLGEAVRKGTNLEVSNGWGIAKKIGTYGDDHLARALVAKIGLGANMKSDAMYPMARVDSDGAPLNGDNRYVLRFAKGKLPPVNGFWSLSMYNSRQFFVKNPLNRFAIGDRNKLKVNRDGSLDIYIQASSPGKDKESNWLPAPSGEDFNVVMRLYWPKQAALDGSWKLPSIEKVSDIRNLSDNQSLQ